MRTHSLFFLIAVLGLTTGCLEKLEIEEINPFVPQPGSDLITITAEHGPSTKTSVEDGGTDVFWDLNEKLRVFNGRGDAEFTSLNEEPARVADFQGNLDYFPGDTLVAVYPWRKDVSFDGATICATLPFFQEGIAGSFADDMNLSVALSTTLDMSFQNVCGGIRFTVSRDDICRVALEGTEAEALAGKLKIGFEDGAPCLKGIEEEANRVILVPSGQETFEPGKWYYIVLAPVTLSRGVSVFFYTQDGQTGVAESENPLTITRSVFWGKENLDAKVAKWEEEEVEDLEVHEATVTVEVVSDADADYVSGLKLSNFFGDYPLFEDAAGKEQMARKRTGIRKASNDVVYNRFTVPFGYVWGNYMFQYITNRDDEMVMCCLATPAEETVISAESTAIGLLMSSRYLITDDPDEIEYIIKEFHDDMPEFDTYVAQIQLEISDALRKCRTPDFSKINKNPVIMAMIRRYSQTPDSIDGLDYLDLTRDLENQLISLKIRNHFRRVIHIYAFREYMSAHGTALAEDEPIGLSVSKVLREITSSSAKKFYEDHSRITAEDVEMAEELLGYLGDIDFDVLPFPYVLEPQSANYWKIVKGVFPWWKDTSSPFESTTGLLDFDLKGADNLRLDIYGLGTLDNLSTYSEDQLLRMVPVMLHGVYVDFIKPLINLYTGAKGMAENSGKDDFKYDLRYGARKAPMAILLGRLQANFPKSERDAMISALIKRDYETAIWIPLKYVLEEIFGNRHPQDKDTYHNLIYNIFKNTINRHKMPDWFRDELKDLWNQESHVVNSFVNEIGFIGATIKLSEAGVDLWGAFQAARNSDFITSFRIPLDNSTHISLLSPKKGTLIHGNTIDFSWDMHLGAEDKGDDVTYDISLQYEDGYSSSTQVIKEITDCNYSLDIASLGDNDVSGKVVFKVIAHIRGNSSEAKAATNPVTIYLADYMKDKGATDLGLSVKWASANLGARNALDSGEYYGWGETNVSKRTFSWATYQHSQSGSSVMKKYNVQDGLMKLLPEDDAVYQLRGGDWRIPTIQEWKELQSQCVWDEIYDDGERVGYCITSNKTRNYIFLPCAGQKSGNAVYFLNYAKYWSSNRDGTFDAPLTPTKARALNEDPYQNGRSWGSDRYLGMPLRGVVGSGNIQPTDSGNGIDLGLSVKWASCNIGASSPEEIGEYFAWGEIRTKSEYTWASYDYSRNADADMKKYNGTDNLQAADAEEDIVHLRYGGNWRMPTLDELNELRNKCTWEEIKEGDVLVCYKITSKENGNFIYLPVTGYMQGKELKDEHRAHYWTGTRNDNSYPHKARALNETHFTSYHDGDDRCLGMPVRGVYDESAASASTMGYVDLGLSVKWASCNIGATAPEYTGNRYAWGSTDVSSGPFTWASYRFGKNGSSTMLTYNGTDDLQYLKREDDVVYLFHKDARWRTPTLEEWQELKSQCTWKNATLNGRRGYLITSTVNDNSIFLPIAGFVDNEQQKDGMQARYWSATRNDNSYPHKARALNEVHFTSYHDGDDRCLGMPVRGVYDESFTRDMISAGEMVDLGLSVKWASHNIGASVPEEAGRFYAWGELNEKSSYTWQGYRFSPEGNSGMDVYNGTDDIQFLKREDDISYRSHTGNGDAYWRTPTIDEWHELQNNCTWEFKILNGRRGYKITSKSNGNSIFLPIAGLKDGTQPKDGMRPRYWSSTRNDNSYPHKARALNETHFTSYHDGDDRCLGMTVRAVYDDSFTQKKLSSGELVDLGLSVRWASHNIGATLPEETGDYYAWGELVPKSVFTWSNYRFSSDGGSSMSKYHGTDDLQLLEREDDIVYQKLQGKWRTPTKAHWDELWNNCDQEIVRKNGRRGYLLTSKINGNSIFIPIAGLIDGSQPKDGMRPRYWSSTRNDNSYPHKARAVNETHFTSYHDGDDRYLGMPIRAIYEDYADDLTSGELIDLGLSVKWASTNMGASAPEETGNYYAWGELKPKEEYSWASYTFSSDGGSGMSRYHGTDNIQYLDCNDDIIHKTKDGDWRMPTIEEWNELKEKCTWVEQVRNGRKGYKITSTVNGNSIFLPIAGLMDGKQRKDGMRPRYWSITRNDNSYPHKARALNETHFTSYHDGDDRCLGMPVRGVFDDSATKMLTEGKFIDMGLSVEWASCNYGVSRPEYLGNYYAWGELDGKITYTWGTYRFSADGSTSMSKYNGTDNYQLLDLNDDVIKRHSGGANRMPTIDEWFELRDNCDWIFKIKNGRPGYVLVSKKNKNAIFLPVLGFIDNEQVKDGITPHYWSATRNDNAYPHKARALNEAHFTSYHDGDDRCLGMPIRAVRD